MSHEHSTFGTSSGSVDREGHFFLDPVGNLISIKDTGKAALDELDETLKRGTNYGLPPSIQLWTKKARLPTACRIPAHKEKHELIQISVQTLAFGNEVMGWAGSIKKLKNPPGNEKIEHALSLFMRGLVHQLRNPVAAVSMGAQLLRTSSEVAGDNAQVLDAIFHDLERLNGSLESLSSYFSPRIPVLKKCSIKQVVETVVKKTRAKAEEGRARLIVDYENLERTVWADEAHLESMITMALENAIESNEGVEVVVTLCIDETSGMITMTVKDNGGGMPALLAEKCTEPLVTDKQGHIGMGLPMTERLAECQGGTLEVSNKDRGCQVGISLPKAD